MTATLMLVDGTAFLFRAFHALRGFSNSRGEPTNAIYGLVNSLRSLLAEHRPGYVAVVFDARGPTFRNQLFPEYKAHRPPIDPELASQIEPAQALVRAMGLAVLIEPGVEADDVIATLATRAAQWGLQVLVVSSDKDLAQLVSDRVVMLKPDKQGYRRLDAAGVEAQWGVPPGRMRDLLALVGDTSDNVPGVPRVGPKTAAKWIGEYGSLDGVIAAAAEIKGKAGESLRASLGQLELARELVTVRRDLDLDCPREALVPGEPDREGLRASFQRFEFRTWLAELGPGQAAAGAGPPADSATQYRCVLEAAELARWVERLRAAPLAAFDTETTSLDYMRAGLVGVSFAVEAAEAVYVPCAHDYPGVPEQVGRETLLAALRPWLEDPGCPKVGQHLKYDMNVLARHGVELRGVCHDTMLESYVLDSTATRHDLDSLALEYLGRETVRYEDVAGKGVRQVGFDRVALEQAVPYAAEDAEVALALHAELWPRLQAEPALRRVYQEIEIPLVPVLSRMERNGVRIDTELLAAQSVELAARMDEVEAAAHDCAGEPFNLGSPRQISTVLFDRLGLPVRSKTPGGQPATTEAVLQELAHEHPLPARILEHRALAKLKSTYADALPERIDPDSGRVHTSYHQAVASTGRLSSSDPNLQNIPVRTAEGRRIRQAFVAAPGHLLVAADYSQIELRIMAHLSRDERLLAAFAAGEDVHRATAAEVFGRAPGEVDAEQRRRAKAINFGLIYGMSPFGLARQLGIEHGEARDYVEAYFARYPGVKRYMDETRARAHEVGYVETVFGRRLHLTEIGSRVAHRRQYAERTAINAPMQGTAADIVKRAMIELDRWLESAEGAGARLIMQVHDELVVEAERGREGVVAERMREIMCAAASLDVPLVVDVGVGADWDAAH